MIHVLLVEDDSRLAALTAAYLRQRQVVVSIAADGKTALSEARRYAFDVILLDLMLPGCDGLEVCRQLREVSDVPLIMLTARGEEADRVVGLELGADDYMVKPYSPRELWARMQTVLRRVQGKAGPSAHRIQIGALCVQPGSRRATLEGRDVELTSYEFDLLHALAKQPGRVLSRERLMLLAAGNATEAFDRAVDVHISRLRQKLGDDARKPRFVRTVRGVGYMLADDSDRGGP